MATCNGEHVLSCARDPADGSLVAAGLALPRGYKARTAPSSVGKTARTAHGARSVGSFDSSSIVCSALSPRSTQRSNTASASGCRSMNSRSWQASSHSASVILRWTRAWTCSRVMALLGASVVRLAHGCRSSSEVVSHGVFSVGEGLSLRLYLDQRTAIWR